MAKMHLLTREEYRLPYLVDSCNQLMMERADSIPMITWPDGRWCIEANLYMLELFNKGRGRIEGGTLLQEAKAIEQLLKMCYGQVELSDVSNKWFKLFVSYLKKRKLDNDSSDNRVIYIARCWCRFLESAGKFHLIPNFISKDGRIRAEKRLMKKDRFQTKSSWWHSSFPTESAYKRRNPITDENIKKIRRAVSISTDNPFIRKRRYAMLTALEVSGGRRLEVSRLTVGSVEAAAAMMEDSSLESPPMLSIETVKKKKFDTRLVPINKADIHGLMRYINGSRKRQISRLKKRFKRRGKVYKDSGYLLISETTGKKLISNTLNTEILELKALAKISQKVSPHMFRHRFCTKILVALIEKHNVETEDGWRKLLIDKESLSEELCQWTGHKSTSSLEVYLHLALREAANYKATFSKVQLERTVESSLSNFSQLKEEALSGDISSLELIQAVTLELESLINDFQEAKTLSYKGHLRMNR